MSPLLINPSPAIAGNALTGKAGSQRSLEDALKKRNMQIWARDLIPKEDGHLMSGTQLSHELSHASAESSSFTLPSVLPHVLRTSYQASAERAPCSHTCLPNLANHPGSSLT